MTITIEIPDELVPALTPSGQDLRRAALEAIALDGYRSDRLTESDIRQLLGFETRMEVHGFLKERGAFLPYTLQDLEHDRELARQVARLAQRKRQEDAAIHRRPR
jgi:glycerol dehydrogenase-like iron-containing ADH family enzyme